MLLDRGDFLLHQRFDLVRAGVADDDQADVVADELRQLLVLEDVAGSAGTAAEFCGSSICASTSFRGRVRRSRISAKSRLRSAEEVLALRHRVGRAPRSTPLARVGDRRERIAHDEHAERDAADDDELPRLPEHRDVAALGGEAADQRAGAEDEAENEIQTRCAPRTGIRTHP